MAPNKTNQADVTAQRKTQSFDHLHHSPNQTSTMTENQAHVENSPSGSKKRSRMNANQPSTKRRRLSVSTEPGTPKSQQKSIPSKLDGMDSWSALLYYVDEFVSRGLLHESQGRMLRKMIRYKNNDLKNMYNQMEGNIQEQNLLDLFQVAGAQYSPALSSPHLGTPGSSYTSPATPHTSAQITSMPQDTMNSGIGLDQNRMAMEQAPSMEEILRQLRELDTKYMDRQPHENSPSAKLQSQLQEQQQCTVSPHTAYQSASNLSQEMGESEVYQVLMKGLGSHYNCPSQFSNSNAPTEENSNISFDSVGDSSYTQPCGLDDEFSRSTPTSSTPFLDMANIFCSSFNDNAIPEDPSYHDQTDLLPPPESCPMSLLDLPSEDELFTTLEI